ncbi:MAG: helix-turn-helix domain-containing protein [Desulfomonilaceae bacterium]
MLSPLLTPKQAAGFLGIRVKMLHQLVRDGKLACIQITPKDRKFSEAQIYEFIESRTIPVPKSIDRKSPSKVPFSRKGGDSWKSTGVSLSERKKMKEELRSWQ